MSNKKTSLEKTENQILYVFGVSLIVSGFGAYVKTWQDLVHLVDDQDDEKFSDYLSESAFNESFTERFFSARLEAITQAGWNDSGLDRKLFRSDPAHAQPIRDYYLKNFVAAIKPKKG